MLGKTCGEKLADAPLRVIERLQGNTASHESDVPAVRREFGHEVRIPGCNPCHIVENIARKERVVNRAEQKRRNANTVDPTDRARAPVVIIRRLEAMNAGGDDVVELVEGTSALESRALDQIRVSLQLLQRLAAE